MRPRPAYREKPTPMECPVCGWKTTRVKQWDGRYGSGCAKGHPLTPLRKRRPPPEAA